MRDDPPLPLLGLALLLFLSFGWGVNWPAMKIALDEVPPWTYRALVGGVGAVGLTVLAMATRRSIAVPRHEWRALVIAAFLNVTLWQSLVAFGIARMPSGQAAVLAFTMPLWAVLFSAAVLGERITPTRLLGLALGMGGVAILLSGDFEAIGAEPLGALFIILGAMSWGAGTVYLKRAQFQTPVLALTAWLVILGSIPMFALSWWLEGMTFLHASPRAAAAIAYSAIVPTVFCYYAWFKIVSLYPAGIAAISTLMVPVIGVVSGILVLGEDPGWREWSALGLVTAALALVLFQPARAAPR